MRTAAVPIDPVRERLACQSLLEALADPTLLLEPSGTVAHANAAACALLGRAASALEGVPLTSLLAEDARRPFEPGHLAEACGRAQPFAVRLAGRDSAPVQVELGLTVRALADNLLLAAFESLSAPHELERQLAAAEAAQRRFAEQNQALQRQRDELELAGRRLAVQYAVLQALAGSSSLEEAAPRILEAIGTHLGWAIGVLWMADPRAAELTPAVVWKAQGLEAPAFIERTHKSVYGLGEGLVGRVFQTGEPAWIEDLENSVAFKRAKLAASEGLRGGIWFPVRHGNAVFGVVEFYRAEVQAPDEETLRAVAALGTQIGHFIERVHAQGRAQENAGRLDTTLRSIADAVITSDASGRVDFMNPVAEALTGWSLEEARGRPLEQVFCCLDERTRERAESPMAQLLEHAPAAAPPSQSLLLSRGGGEVVLDTSVAPIRTGRGQPLGVVLVFRNVTEKRRAEKRRRFIAESSARLATSLDYTRALAEIAQLAVESLADWCAVELLELDGSIRSLAVAHRDPARCRLAREMRLRYPPDPNAAQGIGRVLHTGEPLLLPEIGDTELAATAQDPEHFRALQELGPRSMMIVPLAARGRVLGALVFSASSAARRFNPDDLAAVEELARRAGTSIDNGLLYQEAQEAIRARDEFLSIASHELKTPLTSLKLQVQSLIRAARSHGELEPGKALVKLECADQQMGRLAKLVNDLLDVARISNETLTLELEPVDLVAITREVAGSFSERLTRAGCTLSLQAPAELVGRWDRLRLEQAVTNLLSNAVKYGPGKPIELAIEREGEHATLSITDHGIGIAPSDLDRIFARFERAVSSRHYGGLGVGLFIAQRVLAAMGGGIEVQSRPNEATTFRIRLPLCPGTAADRPAVAIGL